MSGLTLAVVVSVVVFTAGALVQVALGLVRQVKRLTTSLRAMQARLEPNLVELSREASITERELARLGEMTTRNRKS